MLDERVFPEQKDYKSFKQKNLLKKGEKIFNERYKHFFGIIGFIQFVQGYYLAVITDRSTIAKLGRKGFRILVL